MDNKFLWGVASSAFQSEGHIENDMTEWERQGRFKANGKPVLYGKAANHWQMWERDFQLLRELGVNAYRLSLEWARIEPQPGVWDEQALQQYTRMIERLLQYGIEPLVTLLHFSHPAWFHRENPWTAEKSVAVFERFVGKLLNHLPPQVKRFITLNEPLVWLLAAYGDGRFPPGESDLNRAMLGLYHMLVAHRRVYDLIHEQRPQAQVGIAKNFISFRAGRSWYLPDHGMQYIMDQFYNRMLLKAFCNNRLQFRLAPLVSFNRDIALDDAIDFWGINYYYRMHVKFAFNRHRPFQMYFREAGGEGQSMMGWENHSRGLWDFMNLVNKTGKPFMITENGIATENDSERVDFLQRHLDFVDKARRKGWPLQGYFYWSFTDNYEWLEGTKPRFGLYQVDFDDHYARSARQSAAWYKTHIKEQAP